MIQHEAKAPIRAPEGLGLAPGPARRRHHGLALFLLLAAACAPAPEAAEEAGAAADRAAAVSGALPPEQAAFWAALEEHCGHAYLGELSDATAYYRPGLEGRAAAIHFFDCAPERIHVAFHLDDDASRNWILTRAGGTLRLKHDHRHRDGTEDAVSQYGGDAPVPGLSTRQIFRADAHTAEILPERADNFWFLDFADEGTLEYGVHWPTAGHSVRFAFDLSTPVDPPPAPWGYAGDHATR